MRPRPCRLPTPVPAALALFALACGEAPPPPPKAAPPKTVRVHVTNSSRFEVCRVEACGNVAQAVDTGGPRGEVALKQHESSLYEVKSCSGALKVTACPDAAGGPPPCLKAEGGGVVDGTMFQVKTCSY